MTNWTSAQERIAKTARSLRSYFEQKMKKSPVEGSQKTVLSDLDEIFSELEQLRRRRDELNRLESKLKLSVEQLPENVIPLHKVKEQENPVGASKRWMLKLDCLIESPHVSEIHKMALELHSQSFRYAFIEYRDLDRSMRMQLMELLKMGAISLFIPDILELSSTEQKVLKSLVELDTLQRPLVMAGTSLPFAELRSESTLDHDFLALLSRAYFKLTKPFSEYKDQGLINYFLDSLS